MDGLEADPEYLTEGGVLHQDLIETWIDYKREQEIEPVQILPAAPLRVRAVLRRLSRLTRRPAAMP